jgi:DNA-binding NtrC family response regulator
MTATWQDGATPDVEPRRVLIVDEEPLMRWFLSEIASDAGYRATQLSTIDEALDRLHESTDPVAVVLASCPHTFADLPRVAALRQLRPTCRLVLMTSFPTPGFLGQALIAGACRVLHKPIDASDVVSLFVRGRHPSSRLPAIVDVLLRDSEIAAAGAQAAARPACARSPPNAGPCDVSPKNMGSLK